jgi:type II secretory pathway pseudopilin PulG
MWRSCSSRRSVRERGFTLPEVLVSLFSVAIILILAGQTLFATRRASQRQQFQVDARQTARAAIDYISYMLRGAGDMNMKGSDPGMIMAWFWWGKGGQNDSHPCPGAGNPSSNGCYRASWDNFGALGTTDTTFGTLADTGTDIITFAFPDNVQKISAVRWPATGLGGVANLDWTPPSGCPPTGGGDTDAMTYFKTVTGQIGTGGSRLMVIGDVAGSFGFYTIASYVSASCAASPSCLNTDGFASPCIKTTSTVGASAGMNPPGTQSPLSPPVTLLAGARYYSLRVRAGWLEQKDGIFDPRYDNPGSSFTVVLPNVEDLQIAYVFRDGSIHNNLTGTPTFADSQFRVPAQAGNPPSAVLPPALDIANVVAVRVTVTARSAIPYPLESARFTWLDAENHAASASSKTKDAYYRYQTSSLVLLRNRVTGS